MLNGTQEKIPVPAKNQKQKRKNQTNKQTNKKNKQTNTKTKTQQQLFESKTQCDSSVIIKFRIFRVGEFP